MLAGAAFIAAVLPLPAAVKAEYFSGRTLDTPLLQRTDPNIDFTWGSGSPAPVIPNNEFSARWSGFFTPVYSETYTIYVVSDNGSRLKLNGQTVSDRFHPAEGTEAGWDMREIALTAGQRMTFLLEYYESTGNAEMKLYWASPSQPFGIIPASAFSLPDPAPTGWTARYFDGRQFDRPVTVRTDAGIDFEWSGAPAAGLFPDNFSVKWSGLLTPAFSETYTFTIAADNGTRLWIDGNLVSNAWNVVGGEDGGWRSVEVPLVAGRPVPVLLDYYQGYGSASAALYWSSASQPWEIVPGAALTPLPDRTPPWIGGFAPLKTPAGTASALSVQATEPTGAPLRYTATGLPPGVVLDELFTPNINPRGLPPLRTITLRGTPWLPGLYPVIVTAASPSATADTSFIWTVTGSGINPGPAAALAYVQSNLLLTQNRNPDRATLKCIIPETITQFYLTTLERSSSLTVWEDRTSQANWFPLPSALDNPKRESLLNYEEPLLPAPIVRRYYRLRLTPRP